MDVNFSQSVQNADRFLSERTVKAEEAKSPAETGENNASAIPSTEPANLEDIKAQQQSADKDKQKEESEQGIEAAIEEIREFANIQNRQLDFSIDEDSQRRVIRVLDAESGDMIRQIPTDEVLQLAERIKELQTEVGAAVGVFFNKAV
ncbi:flagellar protein FlaG [Lacimicrobium alkaliphilum]|uniref:Flagellar biosynthesis protein FlaG n=1 Tax=Lacimicrobium alkaliphilum TaxID=1526571 RepID=A0ABQ1RN44_9ALTE|nr:flagellar protein FlaG [Lacimicrobium alkaliphilum]GGD72337.1 hypothetical protein GCM10011357_29180 [Lacimicrobium alkaliphilum]